MISRIKFDAGYQQGVAGHLERPGRGSDETNGGQLLASLLNFQIRIFGSIQQTTKGVLRQGCMRSTDLIIRQASRIQYNFAANQLNNHRGR